MANKPVTRKIVTKPALPVKAAPAAKAPAAKAVTVAKSDIAKIVVPAREPRVKVERTVHDIVSPYTGPSTGLNARKSRTALDLSMFGTKPDYVLTERTEKVGRALRAKYAGRPFERANIDAGILKYLGIKGYVEHVGGDGEAAQFRFTADGLKHLPANG